MSEFDPRRRLEDDFIVNKTDRMRNWSDRPKPLDSFTTQNTFDLGGGTNAGLGLFIVVLGTAYAVVALVVFLVQYWQIPAAMGVSAVFLTLGAALERVLPGYFKASCLLVVGGMLSIAGWILGPAAYHYLKSNMSLSAYLYWSFPTQSYSSLLGLYAAYTVGLAIFVLLPLVRRRITFIRAVVYANIALLGLLITIITIGFAMFIIYGKYQSGS